MDYLTMRALLKFPVDHWIIFFSTLFIISLTISITSSNIVANICKTIIASKKK